MQSAPLLWAEVLHRTTDALDGRRCRYGRRARQVNDATDILQVIELSLPVVTHDEDVGAVLLQVLTLVLKTFLDEGEVDASQCSYDGEAFFLGVYRRPTLFADVQRVTGYPDHEPVSQFTGALEDSEVADVEDIEGSKGRNGFRLPVSCHRSEYYRPLSAFTPEPADSDPGGVAPICTWSAAG